MIKVAVLGSGPTGLLAAHAVSLAGAELSIVSKKKRSVVGGAQYLHEAIPHLTDSDPYGLIEFVGRGDADTYAKKVYGSRADQVQSSFERYAHAGEVPAWDIRAAYEELWSRFEHMIIDTTVTAETVRVNTELQSFDLIISSVPLPAICRRRGTIEPGSLHTFLSQTVHVMMDAWQVPTNTIIYDGTTEHGWYRSSNVFGVKQTEWSDVGNRPPLPELRTIQKPMASTCDCWSLNMKTPVLLVGRYGAWRKTALAHQAYFDTGIALHEQFDLKVPGLEELI